jgi:ribonuclease HI
MTEEQMDDITMTKNEAKVVRKLLDQCSSNTRRRRLDRTATGNVEKTSNNTNAWKAKMRLANRKARATSEKELNVKAKTESPRKALALSSEEYTFTTTNPNHKRIVLWTDGSGPIPSTGTAGSAVVYLTSQDNTMMTRSWHLTSCASNDVGELFAVCQALEIALSEVLEWSVKEPYPNTLLGPKLLEVVVYTDSTTALRAVESIQFIQDTIGNPILTKIKATIALLKDLAAMIEIRWIPGHQGDYGNCAADAASKRAARWDPTWDLATSDSSVVPVKIHGATFEVVSRDVVHLDTQPPVTG